MHERSSVASWREQLREEAEPLLGRRKAAVEPGPGGAVPGQPGDRLARAGAARRRGPGGHPPRRRRLPRPSRARAAAPAGDTSWQEVALSADGAAELVPRSVDASGVLVSLAAPPPGVIEFNGGYLHPSLQPERAMAAALARAGRRPGSLGAAAHGGAAGAARMVRARHRRRRSPPPRCWSAAGGQSALTTALRALAPPGAPVLVESPTYPGHAGDRPRGRTAARCPVPVDADGVKPRPARRRLPGERRPGLRLPAAVPEPDRRRPRPRAAGRGAAHRPRGGGVRRRGRLRAAARARGRGPAAARRSPPRTPTAWSCTSGR